MFSLFLFSGGIHAKEGTNSSRQMVMSHLVTILGVDIAKATQLVDEMEQVGLIRFDEFGNVGLLVLEGQS